MFKAGFRCVNRESTRIYANRGWEFLRGNHESDEPHEKGTFLHGLGEVLFKTGFRVSLICGRFSLSLRVLAVMSG